MSAAREFELHLPSAPGSEKIAMEFAASVARSMQFPPERIEDLKSAVGEACSNAIEHGNRSDAATRVGIRLTAADDRLHVAVRDDGRQALEPPPAGAPDIESRIAGAAPPRGWGIHLIRNLMDEVRFEAGREGNIVHMIIYLDRPA